jgi:hypothetical protein
MKFADFTESRKDRTSSRFTRQQHAKQIAMAISASGFDDDATTASFADFEKAFRQETQHNNNNKTKKNTDPFASHNFQSSSSSLFGDDAFFNVETSRGRSAQPRNLTRQSSSVSSSSASLFPDAFSDPGGSNPHELWPVINTRTSATTNNNMPMTKKNYAKTEIGVVTKSPSLVARRRLLKRQQQQQQETATPSMNQNSHSHHNSTNTGSVMKTPPQSPYTMRRTDSTSSSSSTTAGSVGGGGAALPINPKDRVMHYHARNTNMNQSPYKAAASASHHHHHHHAVKSPSPNRKSLAAKATTPVMYSSPDALFSSPPDHHHQHGGGFSFNAFGLDGAEIQREVFEALEDLDNDDFAKWETNSSNATTTTTTYSPTVSEKDFVDGFKVVSNHNHNNISNSSHPTLLPTTANHHHHSSKPSPTRSDRSSSLTSSETATHADAGQFNVFKQQAGFYATSKPRKVVRPSETSQATAAPPPPPPVMPHLGSTQKSPRRCTQEHVEFYDESGGEESVSRQSSTASEGMDRANHLTPRDTNQAEGRFLRPPPLLFDDSEEAVSQAKKYVESASARTESTAATTTLYDEKKEDEEDEDQDTRNKEAAHHQPIADSSPVKSVGNLLSKWESQGSTMSQKAEQRRRERQQIPSALSKEHIDRLQEQLGSELLSPEKLMTSPKFLSVDPELQARSVIETNRFAHIPQQQRSDECIDQRKSIISAKERLKTPSFGTDKNKNTAKSEGGAALRHSHVNSLLSNLEKIKSTGKTVDSRSEVGISSPPHAFLGVKLRKTEAPRSLQPTKEEPCETSSPPAAASVAVNVHTTAQSSPSSSRQYSRISLASRTTTSTNSGGFESQSMRILRQQQQQQGNIGVKNIPSPSRKQNGDTNFSGHRGQQQQQEQSMGEFANGQLQHSPKRLNDYTNNGNRGRLEPSYVSDSHQTLNSKEDDVSDSTEKKLTYRERREIEIQREQKERGREQNEEKNESDSNRDVASLIKQRIAANKKNLHSAAVTEQQLKEKQSEVISSLRNRLKPVSSTVSDKSRPDEEKSERDLLQSSSFKDSHTLQQHSYEDVAVVNEETQQPDHSYPFQNNILRPPLHQSEINDDAIKSRISPGNHDDQRATVGDGKTFKSTSSPSRRQHKGHVANEDLNEQLESHMQSMLPYQTSHDGRSDLVIETDTSPRGKTPERQEPNAAVSHLLMLQRLQQQVPPTSPISREKALSPKNDATSEVGSDSAKGKSSSTPMGTKIMLNAFLAGRLSIGANKEVESAARASSPTDEKDTDDQPPSSNLALPALKDDPKYSRYFKMLSIGMPIDVVKHAMTRDGFDPSVMDGDHNKPVGIPLKDDPEYSKYFKMLKIGLPMEAVKHAMERDGLDSSVMDQDHDLPAASGKKQMREEPKEKDSHRRARLHWKTLRKVTSNSLWAKIDQDAEIENIEIDEKEFRELFQAEKNETHAHSDNANSALVRKRGSTVCVIDPKRANNGGIILARLKMSHDDMADAVERIDENALSAEQIENIIEYLPTKEERKALENYMLQGGHDAAEKFDSLCECEKFMVSMMTVKHAKRKVSALLFKLKFESCIHDIRKEALLVGKACEELHNSVRLRKLLGIILTFGNRLNTAGNGKRKAGAFTLDSLLKLNQAKAFDKKTTFLNYIVLIVRRNNELLLNFKSDLPTVFEADKIFWDQCIADLEEVENQLENVRKIALYQAQQAQSFRRRRKSKPRDDPDESLSDSEEALSLEEEVEMLRATPIGMFTLTAIKYVSTLRDSVENTKEMFARLLEYFGEEERKLQPHELFSIIVQFSRDFDKAKEQVFATEKKKLREDRMRQSSGKTPNEKNGRPPTYSPAQPNRKSGETLKASNFQPSMSAVMSELKSNKTPLKLMEEDVPNDHADNQQGQNAQENGFQGAESITPITSNATNTHTRRESLRRSLYRQSPRASPVPPDALLQTQSPPMEQQSIETPRGASLPTPTTASLSSKAVMREKLRMRRHRASLTNSSSSQASDGGSVSEKPQITMTPSSPGRNDSQKLRNNIYARAASVAPTGSEEKQTLSPRSNMRLKRRMEQHERILRSMGSPC